MPEGIILKSQGKGFHACKSIDEKDGSIWPNMAYVSCKSIVVSATAQADHHINLGQFRAFWNLWQAGDF